MSELADRLHKVKFKDRPPIIKPGIGTGKAKMNKMHKIHNKRQIAIAKAREQIIDEFFDTISEFQTDLEFEIGTRSIDDVAQKARTLAGALDNYLKHHRDNFIPIAERRVDEKEGQNA